MIEKIPIRIPKDLYDKVKRRVKESKGEFKSVEEYVEFVLREIVKKEEEALQHVYTLEEEEKIKKRLRRLGYL